MHKETTIMPNLRRLLFVPLLTVAIACLATSTYAHASPDHGGVTAASARAASPCAIDVTAAPFDVSPALEHASPADTSQDVNLAFDAGVADDRRHPVVIDTPFVERARALGSPPYTLGLTTLTYSSLTITADGAVIVRPQRLNC